MVNQALKTFNEMAQRLQSPFLLMVRLYWGWQFIQTGWAKMNNVGKVSNFFTTLGIPLPGINAHLVAGLKLVGGTLLLIGVLSRLTALLLAANMVVAYVAADREALFSIIVDPDKFTGAAPFTFLMAALVVLTFGAGVVSLDALIFKNGRYS